MIWNIILLWKRSHLIRLHLIISILLSKSIRQAVWSLFYKPYTTEVDWRSAFDKGDIYFIVYDDILVGNIYFYKKTEKLVYLDGFLLKPEYRNLWIWTEALRQILSIARGEWYIQMELISYRYPDNFIAQRVYEQNWFSKWKMIQNYYNDVEPRIYFLNHNLWNS